MQGNNMCILGLLCPSCIPTLFACRETEEKEKEIRAEINVLCYCAIQNTKMSPKLKL